MAIPIVANPVFMRPRQAVARPTMPSAAKVVTSMSNMVSVTKTAHSREPSRIHVAIPAMRGASGQRRRASRPVRASEQRANSDGIRRGHQSLTPSVIQPAWISQNSSGGLWLYGSPLRWGTRKSPRCHISQATPT
jgi:hypothetical protein